MEKELPGRRGVSHHPSVGIRDKLVTGPQLPSWRAGLRQAGRWLVVTNGCFDLLHRGQVTYLERARALGDVLLVGLNSDSSVRALKGSGRPVNAEEDRAWGLAAMPSVDAVCVFEDPSALPYLGVARPDVHVKGGDYTLETVDQAERRAVATAGGRIVVLPVVPGRSTTALLARMARP